MAMLGGECSSCCGGWYCYQECTLTPCCPGPNWVWQNCVGSAPTITVFGATFTLTTPPASSGNSYGWTGGSASFSGGMLAVSDTGMRVRLFLSKLYRYSESGSLVMAAGDIENCKFKYSLAAPLTSAQFPLGDPRNPGTSMNAYEYAASGTISQTGLGAYIRYATLQDATQGTQNSPGGTQVFSPLFSRVGGNSWEVSVPARWGNIENARPPGTQHGDVIGDTTYAFLDGSVVYP